MAECSNSGSCGKSSCEGCASKEKSNPQNFMAEQNVFSDVKYLSFLHFFIARFFEILLISLSSVFFNQKNTIEVRIIVLVKKIQQIL